MRHGRKPILVIPCLTLCWRAFPTRRRGDTNRRLSKPASRSELDPDFAIGYYNLGVNHVYLDRVQEAENVLRRAAARGLEIDEFIMLEHDIAFLKGDQEGMERAVTRARERSGGDTWISNKESYALAYAGQLKKARASSQRAMDQAMQEGQPERAGLWQAGASLREAFFGNAAQAKERAIAALKLSNNREVEFGAALALALSGGDDRVQSLVDDLERRFPEDTVVRFSYLPVLRARAVLNRGDAAKAIELLQAAVPYELGCSRLLFGALYPIYERGEAHLAAHQSTEAAIEFQKILDHRGVVGSDPIGALAHLQLGRAQALSGDKIKAKAEYQAFLTLWKDADPDIPILEQAKAEYAELQ